MEQKIAKGFLKLGIICGLMVTIAGCRGAPSKPGAIGIGGPGGVNGERFEEFPVQLSLQAYEKHLYDPLVAVNCKNCHPNNTLQESHEYMVTKYIDPTSTTARILFETPSESAALLRVAGNHNCSSENCTRDFVEKAIGKWIDDLVSAGWIVPEPVYPNITDEQAFRSARPVTYTPNQSEYLYSLAADGEGLNSFATTQSADEPDGVVESYLTSAPGVQRNANDAAAGSATFTFNAEQDGEYYIWLRVRTPEEGQNSFFVVVNGQTFTMTTAVTEGSWDWAQYVLINNDDEEVPQTVNLEAGPVTVEVRERDGGASFSYVVLTPRDEPNRKQFITQFYDLEFDISDQVGSTAKLVATIWEEAQDEDVSHKVVGVESLRIVSDVPVRVADIKPVINGIYSPTHSMYTVVDTVVGGSEDRQEQIIRTGGAYSTVWIGNFSRDTIAFSFEVI